MREIREMQQIQTHVPREFLPADMADVGEEAQLYQALAQRYPFFDPLRRTNARGWKMLRYPDYCDTHGFTHFRTKTGLCISCNTRPPSVRAIARARGEKTYSFKCEVHGFTEAYVGNAKCVNCFSAGGFKRLGHIPNRARIAARAAGQRTYMRGCALHGDTAHSVIHGKCLTCFCTDGALRKVLQIKVGA